MLRVLTILFILAGLAGWIYFIIQQDKEPEETVEEVVIEVPEPVVYPLSEQSRHVIDIIAALESDAITRLATEDVMAINQAVLSILRCERYGTMTEGIGSYVWDSFAGPLPEVYQNLFEMDDEMLNWLSDINVFHEPISDGEVDFLHMIAVIDIYVSETGNNPIIEPYYDYLMSWGGDLETFGYDMIEASEPDDYESMNGFATDMLGADESSHFSKSDWLADLDGVNIAGLMQSENLYLSEAIFEYYHTGQFLERHTLFVDSFGGEAAFREAVHHFLYSEPSEEQSDLHQELFEDLDQLKTLMHMFLMDSELTLSDMARSILEETMVNKVLDNDN